MYIIQHRYEKPFPSAFVSAENKIQSRSVRPVALGKDFHAYAFTASYKKKCRGAIG